MNHSWKKQACKLREGQIIIGKWHKNRYEIIKQLGYGAMGTVYLAQGKNGLVALKMSENNMAITSEVNVLRHFAKVQGAVLGPSLLDVDDWPHPSGTGITPFYVMEYLKGENVVAFLKHKGMEWLPIFILQLLKDLSELHKAGWVFGDLKPENLLVVGPPPKIRWLDVGGTTMIGRSIKEYTEFFDRGYWGLGSRKAEPSYDLFAVAMIAIQAVYNKRFTKSGHPYEQLRGLIKKSDILQKYEQVLNKAIRGQYTNAEQMRHELFSLVYEADKTISDNIHIAKRPKNKKKGKSKGILETILIASVLLLSYLIILYGHFF